MEYLLQLLMILGFTFAGETLSRLIPLPIPAAVYGLVLLFLALCAGLVKVEKVKTVGNWLIGIMGIFFVAPVVNLLDSWAAVREALLPVLFIVIVSTVDSWAAVREALLPVLFIVIVSTVVVFAVAGGITQWLRRKGGSHD